MYRQKKEVRLCERLAAIDSIIQEQEAKIDQKDKIYLLTVTPLRGTLPDMDFINQHIFFMPYILSYLEACKCGVACVESTQTGIPHYHLWYQTYDDENELARLRWVKVLQRVANCEFETKVVHYKIGKWYSKSNALYYYKEDSVGQQIYTPYNPIYKGMIPPKVDYNDYTMFFHTGKMTARQAIEKTSQIKLLEEFYKKSL